MTDRHVYTYVFHLRSVEERTYPVRTWRTPAGTTESETASLGWFATLDPGGLTLALGGLQKDGTAIPPPREFVTGAKVKLTMEVLATATGGSH